MNTSSCDSTSSLAFGIASVLNLDPSNRKILVHFWFWGFFWGGVGGGRLSFFELTLLLPISEPSSMHSLQLRSAPLCLNLPRQLVLRIFQAQHKGLRKATSKSQLELSPPITHSGLLRLLRVSQRITPDACSCHQLPGSRDYSLFSTMDP